MTKEDQLIADIAFCVDDLELNDEQIGIYLFGCSEINTDLFIIEFKVINTKCNVRDQLIFFGHEWETSFAYTLL